METLIRSFRPEDRKSLINIFRKNTPRFFGVNEQADYEAYLDQNSSTYLSVEIDKVIVGGAGYFVKKEDNSGRITWIFFDPEYTGHGLGRTVVKQCLHLLSQDFRVNKFVVTTSQLSHGFFEKFGFELVRIEKDYWSTGLHLYEMEKQKD